MSGTKLANYCSFTCSKVPCTKLKRCSKAFRTAPDCEGVSCAIKLCFCARFLARRLRCRFLRAGNLSAFQSLLGANGKNLSSRSSEVGLLLDKSLWLGRYGSLWTRHRFRGCGSVDQNGKTIDLQCCRKTTSTSE